MSETSLRVPRRLAAPPASWSRDTDVVVVGSGIAGLSTALRYVERAPRGRVVLVTKDVIANGSTRWAQGGIAAVTDPTDSPLAHMVDTMAAGAGLCDPTAVRTLVTQGAQALRWLVERGTTFDETPEGSLALTREGGHRAARIAHAGGDATGAEIERALVERVRAEPRIELIEHAFVPDLLCGTDASGHPAVCGVTVHVMGEGREDGVGEVHSRAVVLATGGMGQVFAATTNPAVSTGDGLALALRVNAPLCDLEFVQFHPTVLWLGGAARGQQPLISEAVRGEGAVLRSPDGERFMTAEHELADLAPRDVVSRAIARVMARTHSDHVYLDARHFSAATWQERFPTILASCRDHGVDPVHEMIPVVPAAHYASGGVLVDGHGATRVPGLYAVGEVARTGVHGANRLASNSLLEGVVFADRIAGRLAHALPDPIPPTPRSQQPTGELVDPDTVTAVRTAMSRHAGVRRDEEGLHELEQVLAELGTTGSTVTPGVAAWEATNLHTVAAAVARSARNRRETRGSHWRADHPEPAPQKRVHQLVCAPQGSINLHRLVGADPDPQDSPVHAELADLAAPALTARRAPGTVDTHDPTGATVAAEHVTAIVAAALAEDLGPAPAPLADATSAATIPETQLGTADVVARADGVIAGLPLAEHIFWTVTEGAVTMERVAADGEEVKAGDTLLTVTGRVRDLLTAERTALNLLTHLSGIATATNQWVRAIAGTSARIRDTRKTHAGLRVLEKYAVRCGGGTNHRFGLDDVALIKDNHVAAAGGVAAAVRAVRAARPELALEVEVDRIAQIEPALEAGANELLLDNFDVESMARAVRLVAGRARLEASGGLTLDNASTVAATGVDYLAVGALTHSSPALDIAMDLRDTDPRTN
ncbi:L-aspartate oxidase [Lipingzhangella sp. LS1_29]|uniref:L-aspartate oxidase n=1 Tax=Lipingzhangella rawalii TaxID=2055835 RepID=A0ABU2H9G8_9ACTN|nr:L-aspartate oxidase [Lipingzhangella rawalii]MDS1271926.1 L-aspartate oxidase [Lipingzhangella rawalii]